MSQTKASDWADLSYYAAANALLQKRSPDMQRTVFFGDSITEHWDLNRYFPDKGYINRGISGQTTPQMLLRFRQDVVNIQATRCIVLAGTNDLAGNTGETSVEEIQGNIASVCEIAIQNNIRVFLASILPVLDYPWSPGLLPAPKVLAINDWAKKYALQKSLTYIDYYSKMAQTNGALRQELGDDGVHPNDQGYEIMQTIASSVL